MSELDEQIEEYRGRLERELRRTRKKVERVELERRIARLDATLEVRARLETGRVR